MLFWLFLIGLFFILVSKSLLTEGMFFDGVTYASISRNMAEGQGSFWNPHYTQTLYPEFRQHPPLALGMEALAFKALGDHWWVERFYSIMTFLLSGLLLALIWKRTTNNLRWAWLPLLFWLVMPLVTWCATNNMLENTMSIFVLLSVYLMIVGYQRNHKIWLVFSAFALLMAFLSKGFTGLFPLAFPVVYCIFDTKRKWIQGPIDSLLLGIFMTVFAGIMMMVFPGSFAYLKDYVLLQVVGGGLHETTVSSRFYIVLCLLQQLLIPFVLVMTLLVCKKKLNGNEKVFEFPPDKAWFYVFLLLGLLGVLPIMVSVKQSDYYLLAALPFFALACGHASLSMVNVLMLKIKPRLRNWMTLGVNCVALVGVVLNVIQVGKYGRNETLIKDVKSIVSELAGNQMISINSSDFFQWEWHAYFMRYGKVSLDPNHTHQLLLVSEKGRLKIQENIVKY